MQATSTPIILTRAQAQAEQFCTALAAQSPVTLDIRIHPLLQIEYLSFSPPTQKAHLIFTSPHGVYAWCRRSDWRGLCTVVGEQTAMAALDTDFTVFAQYKQVQDLQKTPLPPNAHYIRGKQISHLLPVEQVIAYRQSALPWSGGILPKSGAIFPLFSYQSAVRLLNTPIEHDLIHPITISAQVAKPLQQVGLAPKIALTPDRTAMIKAILQACQ